MDKSEIKNSPPATVTVVVHPPCQSVWLVPPVIVASLAIAATQRRRSEIHAVIVAFTVMDLSATVFYDAVVSLPWPAVVIAPPLFVGTIAPLSVAFPLPRTSPRQRNCKLPSSFASRRVAVPSPKPSHHHRKSLHWPRNRRHPFSHVRIPRTSFFISQSRHSPSPSSFRARHFHSS